MYGIHPDFSTVPHGQTKEARRLLRKLSGPLLSLNLFTTEVVGFRNPTTQHFVDSWSTLTCNLRKQRRISYLPEEPLSLSFSELFAP